MMWGMVFAMQLKIKVDEWCLLWNAKMRIWRTTEFLRRGYGQTKIKRIWGEPCEHDNMKGLKVRKLKQMI